MMLTAFTAGLVLVTISELGDKTFFITAILATRHPRRWVYVGATAALAVMTVLSVALGQTVALLPTAYVRWAEILLFLGFGLKLLYDASRMASEPALEEQQEALEVVKQAEAKLGRRINPLTIVAETFGLVFIAEWGDRTQFTTIALSAANNAIGVTIGATLGHALCAALAVQCGRWIGGRLSERTLVGVGGVLFLIFAAVGLAEMLMH